jgi:hypothetical protein
MRFLPLYLDGTTGMAAPTGRVAAAQAELRRLRGGRAAWAPICRDTAA